MTTNNPEVPVVPKTPETKPTIPEQPQKPIIPEYIPEKDPTPIIKPKETPPLKEPR